MAFVPVFPMSQSSPLPYKLRSKYILRSEVGMGLVIDPYTGYHTLGMQKCVYKHKSWEQKSIIWVQIVEYNMSRLVTKPTKWVCAQRRLRSAWASAQSDHFAVRIKKAWTLSYPLRAQPSLWSDWADAQADLSLRWAHSHIVCFVKRRLIFLSLWKLYKLDCFKSISNTLKYQAWFSRRNRVVSALSRFGPGSFRPVWFRTGSFWPDFFYR